MNAFHFLQCGKSHLKICSFRTPGSFSFVVVLSVMSSSQRGRIQLQPSRYFRRHRSTAPTASARQNMSECGNSRANRISLAFHVFVLVFNSFLSITSVVEDRWNVPHNTHNTHPPSKQLQLILLLLFVLPDTWQRCLCLELWVGLVHRRGWGTSSTRMKKSSWPHQCPARTATKHELWCASQVVKRFETFRGVAKGAACIRIISKHCNHETRVAARRSRKFC